MAKKPEPERTEKRYPDHRDINQVVEENPPPVRQPRNGATETPISEEANAFDKRPWDWRW
jgi:hypothetical protein